jgi:curved DNA-binding protein
MPKLRNPKERGDLYAAVEARLPENLSEAELDLIRQWQKMRSK